LAFIITIYQNTRSSECQICDFVFSCDEDCCYKDASEVQVAPRNVLNYRAVISKSVWLQVNTISKAAYL